MGEGMGGVAVVERTRGAVGVGLDGRGGSGLGAGWMWRWLLVWLRCLGSYVGVGAVVVVMRIR